MGRSTVHYADSETNNILKRLHNKLRPAGTPVQRVEYIIELLLLRIFEVKLTQDPEFAQLRAAFAGDNADLLFSSLIGIANDQILPTLNQRLFPFYSHILNEARKVWTGNLSTKIQDQLVLIEEVFSNSNFSNNVTSGNMAEIICLVADLDKDRLLKTDLLGDAIESALSETGGTKDIGLHRTPGHIRQFMVGLVAPTFDDQIFDPTVGTGGFMFDSFEYVMQGVSQDGHWPGPKAHPELAAWFKDWFAKHPVSMPSVETATDFYRSGVGGIEYLGMIRKMAAINFYVRGLNPGNIQQGDALEKFGTEILPQSKTAIIANPPFGAERDKESYPNVWSEYPTESETTILFVKLMLETLKPGGRCAVVVSEGFLTWDQNSARALRRALLDECDLQAVVSLPQGVFVSKGGQGPKTSILYFVKGGHTRNVWFYRVGNDGYTMGTNRKIAPGCQLVEALDLFHRYVRKGELPPEARHSFCIPADWIKVLDPRVKDRIREDTRAEMGAKAAEEKTKLTQKLDAQSAAKKLTASERLDRLALHDELWRSKTENAIAQKIERAHLYSFNLSNQRSSLTATQLAAWKDLAATYVRDGDVSATLENQYRTMAGAAPEELDALISALDPRHTLELDIARQFLTGVSPDTFTKHPHLRTLQEIIASQQKAPRVQLKELLEPVSRPVVLQDGRTYRRVTVKLYGKGVVLRDRVTMNDLKGEKWFQVKEGDLIFSKIDARNGAFGLIPEALDDGIVSNEFPTFRVKETQCNPALLTALVTCEQFYGQIETKVSGASGRRRFEPEDLLNMEIPLVEKQNEIAVELARIKAIIESAQTIEKEWEIGFPNRAECQMVELGEVSTITTGSLDANAASESGAYPFFTCSRQPLRIDNYAFDCAAVLLAGNNASADFNVKRFSGKFNAYQRTYVITPKDPEVLSSDYIYFVIQNALPRLKEQAIGAGTKYLKLGMITGIRFPLPPYDLQQTLVSELNEQEERLGIVRSLHERRESEFSGILNRIWES